MAKLESLKCHMGACAVESDPHPRGLATTVSCSWFLLKLRMEQNGDRSIIEMHKFLFGSGGGERGAAHYVTLAILELAM